MFLTAERRFVSTQSLSLLLRLVVAWIFVGCLASSTSVGLSAVDAASALRPPLVVVPLGFSVVSILRAATA